MYMEKKSTVQIKYEDQEIQNQPVQRIENVFGVLRCINGTPSGTPVKFADQIVLDYTNSRLFVFDLTSGTWKYATLSSL